MAGEPTTNGAPMSASQIFGDDAVRSALGVTDEPVPAGKLPAGWWSVVPTSPPVAEPVAEPSRIPPPPPAPPAPAAAPVPPRSPAPPAHAPAPEPIRVPPEQDRDGDGWPDQPALEQRRQPVDARTSTRQEPEPKAQRPSARDRARDARPKLGDFGKRYRWAVIGVAVVAALVLARMGVKELGNSLGRSASEAQTTSNAALVDAIHQAVQPRSTTVNVATPLSWLKCPLTGDAAGMIGFDPPGSKVIDAARAQPVADQVATAFAEGHGLPELRLTQGKDGTSLQVFVGAPNIGVPLVDCTFNNGQVPKAQSTPSSTPTSGPTLGAGGGS